VFSVGFFYRELYIANRGITNANVLAACSLSDHMYHHTMVIMDWLTAKVITNIPGTWWGGCL